MLTVLLNATKNHNAASYGRIGLFDNGGHVVNIPISIVTEIFYKSTS